MTELVPIDTELAERDQRRATLDRLNADAETAATPAVAREVMLRGQVIADMLAKVRAPFEDTWLAGKASVVAARRLGCLLAEVSSKGRPIREGGYAGIKGMGPSDRTLVVNELGLRKEMASRIVRLGRVPDPEFQRFIQSRDRVPSISGALAACSVIPVNTSRPGGPLRDRQRRRHGVTAPSHPSVDAAYASLRQAAGHLGGSSGGNEDQKRARYGALSAVYVALDAIYPYTSGYGER